MAQGHVIKQGILGSVAGALFIVLCMGSIASVHAAETVSALPRISEIYPDAPGSTSSAEKPNEFIELANSSTQPLNLAGFQLRSTSDSDKYTNLSGSIPASGYLAVHVSFGLLNNGDTIQLARVIGDSYEVVEAVVYGDGATEALSWSYFSEGWELASKTEGAPNQRTVQEPAEPPTPDACPATEAIDSTVPEGYIVDTAGNCVEAPLSDPPEASSCLIEISEISSQPTANGQEYIELFNPAVTPAELRLCGIKINTANNQMLPELVLEPGARHVLYFTSGTIKNSEGEVALTLSDNRQLSYTYFSADAGEVTNYPAGSRQGSLSNKPTPGFANEAADDSTDAGGSGAALADCGPGKYRSPETNRCRNIETAEASLTPCAPDQERNPATNRCRKIAAASATLTPCQPGQERNPETNRCRKIGSSTSTLKPCDPGQERNPETNRCRKVASAVSGTPLEGAAQPAALSPFKYKTPIIGLLSAALVGYGAYEYRNDLRNFLQKAREKKRRGRPPG